MQQKLFGFDPSQHKARTEIYAGITTFLTMADAVATTAGACLGTSTTTTYVESAAATGPALIIVGVMMCTNTIRVHWEDYNRGHSRFCHHVADATELQHQRRHHAGTYYVCADENRHGHEGHPPNQSHSVGAFRHLRAPL